MKLPVLLSVFSCYLLAGTTNIYAGTEASSFGMQINQGLATFADIKEEAKASGQTNELRVKEIHTNPSNLEVVVHFADFHIYTYPTLPGSPIAVGYSPNDLWEFGLSLGIKSIKVVDPEIEESTQQVGFYTVLAPSIASLNFEFNGYIGAISGSKKVISGENISQKESITGSELTLGANIVIPIEGSLHYVGGLLLGHTSQESRESGITSKTKTSIISVNLATLRLDL